MSPIAVTEMNNYHVSVEPLFLLVGLKGVLLGQVGSEDKVFDLCTCYMETPIRS